MKRGIDRLGAFVLNRTTDGEQEQWWSVIALVFILHVVLALPVLTPNLKDIGRFDESFYIEHGRMVGANNLPAVDGSPITAFFYALTYIPVHESDFWSIHSCTIGRFVLFALLWVSSFLVAKRIPDMSSPLMMIGFLLVSPALTSLITNGNHALFTAISTFALAQIISFYQRKEITSLWIASVLVSLALLTRMGEGTFLLVAFITLSILFGISFRRVNAVLAAAIIPVVVIVGGYMLTYYCFTGKSPLPTGEYFYATFELGHIVAYEDQLPGLSWPERQIEAQRLFGTQEQNQNSVIAAIQHNPRAYLGRVPRLAKVALATAMGVYGGPLGYGAPLSLWFLLLAIQGCIELVKKKHFMLLCILLFWPSYLVIYTLLVSQPTHFLFPFPVVFCLASIGLTSIVSLSYKQRYLWSAMLVALIGLAIGRDSSLPIISSAVALLMGLWIVWIAINRYYNLEIVISSAFVFLFSMMLLFRGGIPPQKMRKLGIAPDEQAVLFLRRNFAKDTPMAASSIVPRAAKMNRVNLAGLLIFKSTVEKWSAEELQRWMINNNLETIYVDYYVRRNDALWALIESQIGKSLEIAFSSDNEGFQILRITKSAKLNFNVTS
jgi:hypothetical protein